MKGHLQGTLKYNLDPLNIYENQKLNDIITKLREKCKKNKQNLRTCKNKLNTWHKTISPISFIEFYWNSLAEFQKNPAIIKKKIFY